MNSELGEEHLAALRLSAARNQLHVEFFGLDAASEAPLRYQYRLKTGGSSDWSPASEQQAVDFAGLGPGQYVFDVRAVNANGLASSRLAGFAFTVDVPVWRSWWFLSSVVVSLALGAWTPSKGNV